MGLEPEGLKTKIVVVRFLGYNSLDYIVKEVQKLEASPPVSKKNVLTQLEYSVYLA